MTQELRAKAERLRQEVRDFYATVMPAELRDKAHRHQVLSKEDYVGWMRLLDKQGWSVAHWPEALGGKGWSPLDKAGRDKRRR